MIRAGVFCCAALILTAATPTGATDELHVPRGFSIETIAEVNGARELAALPNGDLIVGTRGKSVYIVADAEERARSPLVFASFDDDDATGVAFAAPRSEIIVASEHHVYAIAYHRGESRATSLRRIADVRTGPVAPGTDGDVHVTTSAIYVGAMLYVAAGSSCNATMDGGRNPCAEADPTRAAVSLVLANGTLRQRARRVRNAIALAVNPQTGSLWIGGAGQDDLPFGHPYEFLDDLSARSGDADYGWPQCEENHHAYAAGADCSHTVVPLVELPAYSTIIGAAFYPGRQRGPFAFPPAYRNGLFATAHGSWHTDARGCFAAPPRVVFIAMRGDRPVKPVDWKNPTRQWTDFVTGFQPACRTRIGRPTGIAVGAKGSLFVADDESGAIYRIRPVP